MIDKGHLGFYYYYIEEINDKVDNSRLIENNMTQHTRHRYIKILNQLDDIFNITTALNNMFTVLYTSDNIVEQVNSKYIRVHGHILQINS